MKCTFLGGVAISALMVATPLSTANAADLGYKAPPPPPPAWSWTGFYVGLQGGAGWGTVEDQVSGINSCVAGVCGPVFPTTPGFARSSFTINGMFGGGTAGFNWQTGPVVFGVEGDFSGANIDGNSDCKQSFGMVGPTGAASTCSANMAWFGTATGRLGIMHDQLLLYVKGGGAWAHFDHDAAVSGVAFFASGAVGDTPSGYTFGTGLEYALWGGWSAKIEYDYMDFGTKNIVMPLAFPAVPGAIGNEYSRDNIKVDIVRAGLNYRFNWWGPVVAKD